ncbi:MAG TPA: ATP-binding protein [Bryobacteraceae bacterium]|jgi:signal transduction histidine kinase
MSLRPRLFRTRLLVVFTAAMIASVAIVDWLVTRATREAFERFEAQNARALAAQFRREFQRRGDEVVQALNSLAASDAVVNIALAADYSPFYNEASALASANRLDLLELVAADGTIISSAEWPARFGYKEDWLTAPGNWKAGAAFLRREELPDGVALALVSVADVNVGDRKLYLTGGQRLDRDFLSSLVLREGMRALLYRNLPGNVAQFSDLSRFQPIINQIRSHPAEITQTLGNGADAEIVHALPLNSPSNDLLGALLITSSRREIAAVESVLLRTGIDVAAAGILIGIVLAWWATTRVTRPVRALAETAQKVAAGNWGVTVDQSSQDEIGQLAEAFNSMTSKLVAQRERLLQTERVAAWRELARRLAHELRNPLFPLQLTVENMRRAHETAPGEFEEVFREGTDTLLAELSNLKQIIARFSDFAKMPAPEMHPVQLNEVVVNTVKLFEPQLAQAHIACRTELDSGLPIVAADAEQLARALRNLILNAIDAMPQGGVLILRTQEVGATSNGACPGSVRLEVSDTGQGLTPEECERLFTPYYTTKTHGTGLGLAIVQSVVSDHHGRISVESQPGKGTCFRIDLG